jgi:23S rRNA (guanosine2251-2'-O)-methyltransferase
MSERLPYLATQSSAPYETLLKLPVAVLLDNVRSMYNVGSFFRTMDAAGCQKLYLCGITARPPMRAISKTALGSEETVPWEHQADPVALACTLRTRTFELAAIETTPHAVDLFDWQPRFPVCLLFGHEVDGLNPRLLEYCDTHVRIPMLGRKHWLNVATAGGVVIHELLRKYRRMNEAAIGISSVPWSYGGCESQASFTRPC